MVLYQRIGILAGSGAIAWALGLAPGVVAQITPDHSLGGESSFVTPNVVSERGIIDRIDGGAVRGSSLFHSFQDFNVGNLQRVYFANPSGIDNILGRVTGTQGSNIFGTLGVLGNANLYFINPNGIIFGDKAQLDIRGSFFASTNTSIPLTNGYQFSTENPNAPPLLTLNVAPGLQNGLPAQGTIASTGNLSVGGDLTLVSQNLNLEGQLYSGRNTTLNAAEKLKVRDSAANPFIASAGAQLFVQGNKIDIFALNHPASGFFSGGDMVFRSANALGGNAHFSSGGNFILQQMDGTGGELSSSDDPVIRASGDVSFDSYEGASLHIFAGCSVTIGNIFITGPDTTNFINETVTLSDGQTTVPINGGAVPTVDIRAGTTAFNPTGITGDTTSFTPIPNTTGTGTSANITIDGIFNFGGLVFLTNQYQPNPSLSGDITLKTGIATALGPSGGGDVVIDSRGKITTPNFIDTSGFDFATSGFTNPGGDITLLAQGDIFMPNPSQIFSYGSAGGSITMKSQSAIIQEEAPPDESYIEIAGYGAGQGGDLILEAPRIFLSNAVQNNLRRGALGPGGKLIITADSLEANRARLINVTRGGDAGNVIVNADSISLNESQLGSLNRSTTGGKAADVEINTYTFMARGPGPAVLSETQKESDGRGGNVRINASSLSLQEGSQVRTTTLGSGDAGNIEIRADDIVVDGSILLSIFGMPEPFPAGIVSETSFGGRGGVIDITTRRLSVSNGALISASTNGEGDAGTIFINASESASFDGNPGEPLFPSGAFVGTLKDATGRGGTLTINTPFLSVTNGAQLEALTESSANAGEININANTVFLSGADTGLFSNTTSGSTGNGGLVRVEANSLRLQDGAQISASTSGAGEGGEIIINASQLISLSGENTGIFSSTTPESTGKGGSIFIDPEQVEINDGAAISVDSQGTGIGGNIELEADQLRLDNGRISAETTSADGGNITLSLSDVLLLRRGSKISTTAGTVGAGGNGGDIRISLTRGFIIAVDEEDSDITANAFLGNGGNIDITAENIFGIRFRPQLTPLSDITASSKFGLSGTVSINGLNVDPSSGLVELPGELADASDQVVVGCAAAEGNSFTVTGRGGLPEDPTATIRGQTVWRDLQDFSDGSEGANTSKPTPQARLQDREESDRTSSSSPIVEATGWVKDENGHVTLVASTANSTSAGYKSKLPDCQQLSSNNQ